ncbi:unnamed protein product [Soboliphyme baturini]|uniref:HABP4_PAI-RBP1 domain-containing protein n=1 Tax=Soboliphyme baturini TaxID=241478 RepID=A0A183IPT9_9BILA|nr:unnamed protein product [Soboliphyme baturini]
MSKKIQKEVDVTYVIGGDRGKPTGMPRFRRDTSKRGYVTQRHAKTASSSASDVRAGTPEQREERSRGFALTPNHKDDV